MHVRNYRQRIRKPVLLATVLAMLVWLPVAIAAGSRNVTDIAPFGLLEVDKFFTARYLFDDQERSSAGSAGSFQTRATWEEQFNLMTRSFVYHPGFLNMEFGGSAMLLQQQFDSDLGDNQNNETLFNFTGRLNFLELKQYPFSLYYQRSHPSVFTSLSGRFLAENDDYGFTGHLNDWWGSTSMQVDLGRHDTLGSGFGSIIDEKSEQRSIRLVKNYRGSDRIQLRYNRSEIDSAAASPGLPLQNSRIFLDNYEVQSLNVFGKSGQVELRQFLRKMQQDTETTSRSSLDNRDYTATVRWQHSERTSTRFGYRLNRMKRTGSNSRSENIDLSIFRTPNENLRYDAGLDYSSIQQVGFNRDRKGGNGSIAYSRPTFFGSVGIAGSLRGERSKQDSSAETIRVFDEPIVQNDTTPARLANDFVQTESVIVSNVSKTRIFVVGLDYRLVTIGATTSVQRLINSNITDGETVLVEYRYRTSGTAEFDSLDSSISVTASFHKTFNAYARYTSRQTDVRDGELTNPLNDLNSFEFGLGLNYPFRSGWAIAGQFRHVDQDEEISPLVHDSIDVNVSTNLTGSFRLFVSTGLLRVNHENSVEDVDQVSYRLGLNGRIWRRIQFGYEAVYLNDTGGTLRRRQLQHRLNMQWAYRQVRVSFHALTSKDTLGATERRYSQVTAQITRAF